MSRAKRCRRAISKATRAVSTAVVGGSSGDSTRPTCRTKIVLAPAVTACSMGIELTIPPSMKCSSSMRVAGKQPRHRRRREDRVDERARVEDVLRGSLDARGHDLQRHREVFEAGCPAQARSSSWASGAGELRWVLVLTSATQLRDERVAVDGVGLGRRPRVHERVDDPERRVARDERAVDRADRRPHDEIGLDACLEEGAHHADLDGSAHAAAAEHERGGSLHPASRLLQPIGATTPGRTRRP